MVGEVRVYSYPGKKMYMVKDGTYRSSSDIKNTWYTCKLHHPDAAEVELIRADVAGGMTIRAAMAKYAIGSYARYHALMKKVPAAGAAGAAEGVIEGIANEGAATA